MLSSDGGVRDRVEGPASGMERDRRLGFRLFIGDDVVEDGEGG